MDNKDKLRMIAFFMGAELTVSEQGILLIDNTMELVINGHLDKLQFKYDELRYDLDWHWLMPVVERIESLGFEFFIVENRCKINHNTDNNTENVIDITVDGNKLNATYVGVVAFIDWYNANKKKHLLIEQTKLLHEIVAKANINVVTCGNCGCVTLHKTDVETLKCFQCGYEDEVSSFPDLFFEHY